MSIQKIISNKKNFPKELNCSWKGELESFKLEILDLSNYMYAFLTIIDCKKSDVGDKMKKPGDIHRMSSTSVQAHSRTLADKFYFGKIFRIKFLALKGF